MRFHVSATRVASLVAVAVLGTVASGATPNLGWRGDGTGAYPDVTPVIEWGPEKNVIWKTPLPSWSNATPIIVGDKVFVCAEPSTLICVSKKDGAILWSKANDLKDAYTDEQWKVVETRRKERADILDQIAKTNQQVQQLSQKIQFGTQDARDKNEEGRRKAYDQQVAAAAKREEARRAAYDKSVEEAKAKGQTVAPFKPAATMPAFKALDYGPLPAPEDVEKMKTDVAGLKKTAGDLTAKVPSYQDVAPAQVDGTNGFTTPTPTSDGKNVWVLFNSGALACYDLDGNRKWTVDVGYAPPAPDIVGTVASPLLADGRIVVHTNLLKAVDAATGKQVWAVAGSGAKRGAYIANSPVRATMLGQEVVVTVNGLVVRAADGQVLIRDLGNVDHSSPVVKDGVAYLIQGKAQAWRLPESADDTAPKRLWSATLKNQRYYGSALVYKGVVYAITEASAASAIDAADGKVLWEKPLPITGTVYSSVTGAGDYVLFSSEKGQTVVLKAGKTLEQVQLNTLEPFRSCPIFEDGRMYVRTLKNLYCIGKP